MKTILQAILDEIFYPINHGLVENKLVGRGINPDDYFTPKVSTTNEYKGALADSLYSLIQAVNISEADKSIGAMSDSQRKALLVQINKLYETIGEAEVTFEPKPMVFINC